MMLVGNTYTADHPEEVGEYIAALQRYNGMAMYDRISSKPAWKDEGIKMVYVVGSQDSTVPEPIQRSMVEVMRKEGAVFEVVETEWTHCPNITAAKELANILINAISKDINLQHYLWCEIFGYHLHPSFAVENRDLTIADVGTGTGYVAAVMHNAPHLHECADMHTFPQSRRIWLLDLVARLPATIQFQGLDVSFAAMAPKSMLPSNVTLHQWNVKDPVPAVLIDRYDVLHIRHFMFVLRGGSFSGASTI
ncbi:hypothetical protein NUW58_g10434 [Xylaria curta]|uniref:Uncharacterized protein n=1 Tax=Xylaria curta TaxID=42375 RepID=A0ACC1MKH7_9PEZI|nr:hypothetical protein NUW58_g10434 [Xylaria curta]